MRLDKTSPPHLLRLSQIERWTTKVQGKVCQDTFLPWNVPSFCVCKNVNPQSSKRPFTLSTIWSVTARSLCWGPDERTHTKNEFWWCWRSPYSVRQTGNSKLDLHTLPFKNWCRFKLFPNVSVLKNGDQEKYKLKRTPKWGILVG